MWDGPWPLKSCDGAECFTGRVPQDGVGEGRFSRIDEEMVNVDAVIESMGARLRYWARRRDCRAFVLIRREMEEADLEPKECRSW